MKNSLIYHFSSEKLPELSEIGGKAQSLIIMKQEGFSVPNGFVLAVDFFEPWFEEVEKSEEWKFCNRFHIIWCRDRPAGEPVPIRDAIRQ